MFKYCRLPAKKNFLQPCLCCQGCGDWGIGLAVTNLLVGRGALPSFWGSLEPIYFPALPVLHGLPGDGVPGGAVLVQQVLALLHKVYLLQLSLRGPLWSSPRTSP